MFATQGNAVVSPVGPSHIDIRPWSEAGDSVNVQSKVSSANLSQLLEVLFPLDTEQHLKLQVKNGIDGACFL